MGTWNARIPGLEPWSKLIMTPMIPTSVKHLLDAKHHTLILFNLHDICGIQAGQIKYVTLSTARRINQNIHH